MSYQENDFELIYLALQNNPEAVDRIIRKYHNLVWHIINNVLSNYHPPGVEKEDLYQEGIIAVHDAIYTFRTDYNTPFYSFVKVCIERQIKSYIRKFNSKSSRQFYFSQSLDMPVKEEEGFYLYDVLEDESVESPFEVYLESLVELVESQQYSILENNILVLKIMGYSYQEISERLGCKEKQIDNTIQKIKRTYSD